MRDCNLLSESQVSLIPSSIKCFALDLLSIFFDLDLALPYANLQAGSVHGLSKYGVILGRIFPMEQLSGGRPLGR